MVSKNRPGHRGTAHTAWAWHLGRESYPQRGTVIGVPGRGAFNHDF